MTKVHFISIGVIALILLVIFGHNPSKYFERKKMEAANKSLVYRIMKHNDPAFGKTVKAAPPRNTGIDIGGDTTEDKEAVDTSQSAYSATRRGYRQPAPAAQFNPGTQFNTGGVPAADDSAGTRSQSSQQYRQYQQPQSQQQPQAPAADSYYPPAPRSSGQTAPRSELNQQIQKPNGLTMPDGKVAVIEGTKVYEIDSNGAKIPMKDGTYKFGSAYTMIVRGGERYSYE